MLTDRQKLILKAIIDEYVISNEPVGSKMLTEKPYLDFSSATLRYEMQHLEEEGYLKKTHTSSGRVPSEQGIRYYVDNLIVRDEDVRQYYKYIDEILDDRYYSTDEKIKKICEFLSELTGYYVSIITYPNDSAKVLRLEIVPLSDSEAVLLIVTSTGDVESATIKIPNGYKIDDLMRIIQVFDTAMYGHSIYEIRDILSNEASKPRIRQMIDFKDDILNFMIKAFSGFLNGYVTSAGLSKLFNQPEFQDFNVMQRVIKAIDEYSLAKYKNSLTGGVIIHVGTDNPVRGLEECSSVLVPFSISENQNGVLSMIGPLRMNYKACVPILEFVANRMKKLKEEK